MMWDRLATLMRAEETFEEFDPEPRWPVFIAILAVGGLYAALPEALTMGPRWVFPSLVLGLLMPTIASHHAGRHRLNTIFGFAVDAILTVGLIISLILLINALPTRQETPQALLLSAACLWIRSLFQTLNRYNQIGMRREGAVRS